MPGEKSRRPFNQAVFFVPMAWLLIAVNLVPLAGVYFWDWDIFSLMFLYWVESTILWACQVAKSFLLLGVKALTGVWWLSLVFGWCMLVLFMFICAMFGPSHGKPTQDLFGFLPGTILGEKLWIPVLAMAIFHGLTFYPFVIKKLTHPHPSPSPEKLRVYHSTSDWQSVLAPSGDRTEVYFAPSHSPHEPGHPSEGLRVRNAMKVVGWLLFEPFKRFILLLLAIYFGGLLGIVLHHLQTTFIFMILLKIYLDLYYYGQHLARSTNQKQLKLSL